MNTSKVSFESTPVIAHYEPTPEVKEWHTFGCIQSRFALLGCATLLTLMSLTSLLMGSVLYNKLYDHITEYQRVTVIMHLFVYAVLVFFCVFGLYSVLYRSRRVASMFCAMLFGQILFEIASGAICLHFLFRYTRKEDYMGDLMHCLESIADSPKDLFIRDLCYRTPIAQGVCLALFLFMWILQLVTFYASNRYVAQLQHEENADDAARARDVEEYGEIWK
ncbi:hypothetical protein H1R20_g12588, partial [Candolleomyces eurysporus]